LLFILPDLHGTAAARARIAIAGDDDELFSLPVPVHPHTPIYPIVKHERSRDASVRETSQSQNGKLELGRHVAVGWQVTIDFETDADFD